MFVEVTATERTFIRDASPETRMAAKETPEENRKLFTLEMTNTLAGLRPRFSAGAEYLTGENYPPPAAVAESQRDGVSFPADSTDPGVHPARLSAPTSMSALSYAIDGGNTTKNVIYLADNAMSGGNVTGGKVRVVDVDSGTVTSLSALSSATHGIYSVAAHRVEIDGKMNTIVYAGVDGEDFWWYNMDTGKKVRMVIPTFNTAVNFNSSAAVNAYRNDITGVTTSCLAAAKDKVYLQLNGKIYDFESSKCGEGERCEMRALASLSGFDENDAASMHCTVYAEGESLIFYASQGGSLSSVDLAQAKQAAGDVETKVVVPKPDTDDALRDGANPVLGSVTGMDAYMPPWAAAGDIHLVLVAGGQLKVMSSDTTYTTSLAPASGPVAVLGEHAIFGQKLLYRSSLGYAIPCKDVNHHLARPMLEWKVPVNKISVAETVAVNVTDGVGSHTWEFTALKKTAVLKQGFMEKTMVCMHKYSANVNTTKQKHIHCCMSKFSKQHQGRSWEEQILDTELY
jgi:hypothetical protein